MRGLVKVPFFTRAEQAKRGPQSRSQCREIRGRNWLRSVPGVTAGPIAKLTHSLWPRKCSSGKMVFAFPESTGPAGHL